MYVKCVFLLTFIGYSLSKDLVILQKTSKSYLETYEEYSNVVVNQFVVPQDSLFASFKFLADETQGSIFSCSFRNVSLYMKQGSPPVINPDKSPLPKEYKNITRSALFNLEFRTDKKEIYLNITSPQPGSYYVATFLSYRDPRFNAITQQGLAPTCYAYLDSSLHALKIAPDIITENRDVQVNASSNSSKYFKFYVPDFQDHAILTLTDFYFSPSTESLLVRIGVNKPPSEKNYQKTTNLYNNVTSSTVLFWTEPESWHYLEFKFRNGSQLSKNETSRLTFKLRFYSNQISKDSNRLETENVTEKANSSLLKLYRNERFTSLAAYEEFDLVRTGSGDTLIFQYSLEEELDSQVAVPINITSDRFSLLKFKVRDASDIGGNLQFVLAFKSSLKNTAKRIKEPENHTVVACLSRFALEVPSWPNKCSGNGFKNDSQLILNATSTNSTIVVPYPESGLWYATFKLFCGTCDPCNCSDSCQNLYESCLKACELNCTKGESCGYCSEQCSSETISKEGCSGCDCDGLCLKNTNASCNTSVVFDVSSRPCNPSCGYNGRCIFMLSDGVPLATCSCMNKYRGWDCSDDTLATAYYLVVLELLLLVLSNLAFLPAVYVAFKRKYYVESLTYFSICFFSTFYHSCDAGENILSYCLVRLSALQFGDFFCALLAIWVTLVAIADLQSPVLIHLLHVGAAIILSFCTVVNRTALWIFALAAVTGILVIAISWYLKFRKVRQRFANRRYLYVRLPIGGVIVAIGLVMYAFLQTEDNYKYLHTLWHLVMAVAVLIVLPERNTFVPEVLL